MVTLAVGHSVPAAEPELEPVQPGFTNQADQVEEPFSRTLILYPYADAGVAPVQLIVMTHPVPEQLL